MASEVPLTEADGQVRVTAQPDVIIQYADDTSLDRFNDGYYFIEKGDFHFHVPEAAVICVSSGNRITVSPLPGADEARIRLYLLGTCMGILLMQRGILPLHGSAVAIDGKAYAIVGESGAGKSTLAATFASEGYRLLTDDVIAVDLVDEVPIVNPSYPQQKLWQESLDHLGQSSSNYSSIFQRARKYAVPIPAFFHQEPLALAGVIELTKSDHLKVPSLEAYNRLQALHILNVHTYRGTLTRPLGLHQWHFQAIAQLAAAIPVHRLSRPAEGFSAFQLMDQVLNITRQEEAVINER